MKRLFLVALVLLTATNIKAQDRNSERLRERVYLQTDKHSYIPGELMWMKVLITDVSGIPIDFSKVVYAELVDEQSSLASVKIELRHGHGGASLVVPEKIPSGIYKIVAYTRFMQNEDADVFFEKYITIVNPVTNQGARMTNDPMPANISKHSPNPYNADISLNGEVFGRRERVSVNVSALPEDVATLSVTVTGSELINIPLAGDIPVWKQKIADSSLPFSGNFEAEYEGHIIPARLIDRNSGTPVYSKDVTPLLGVVGNKVEVFGSRVETSGDIYFHTGRMYGKADVATVPMSYDDSDLRIDLQSPFVMLNGGGNMPDLPVGIIDMSALEQRSLSLQVLYSYNSSQLNTFSDNSPWINAKPDKVYIMEEWAKFGTMQEVVTEFVTFVRFRKVGERRYLNVLSDYLGYSHGNSLLLLDGIPVSDHEVIYQYDPQLLQRIEIYFDRYIIGGNRFEGIIALYTHKNNYPTFSPTDQTQVLPYEGIDPGRVFYSPQYDSPDAAQSRLPDYRHTLYWDADMDTVNRSATAAFYTSDLAGEFTVRVEGVTKSGEVIYSQKTFRVAEK